VKHGLFYMFATVAFGTVGLTSGPASSTTAVGPYYATPSWDQQLPASTRFVTLSNWVDANFPLGGAAVLDRETGIVWERSPNTDTLTWHSAQSRCNRLAVGKRRGWRLPTIQELASLADADPANVNSPRLPVGHPFTNVQSSAYWSGTTFLDTSSVQPTFLAWHLFFSNGEVGAGSNKFLDNFARAWCVRGGQGLDPQ